MPPAEAEGSDTARIRRLRGIPIRYQLALAIALVVTTCATTAQSDDGTRTVSSMVFAAFPEADTVRHIVRDIDRKARKQIEAKLPFKIHFQELGEHKLHVAFRGPKPVGLMYVRSEQTEWGIADIGWALSLDCRVLGFAFANSRSRETRELPRSQFAKNLVGCSFDDLTTLHAGRPVPAGESSGSVPDSLSRTVLRSAMKATLVTELVWQDQVSKLADLAMLFTEMPGAMPGRHHLPVLAPGKRHLVTLHVIEARGQTGYPLGKVVRTRARLDAKNEVELRWVIDVDGQIVRVKPARSWPDEKLRLACGALRGRALADAELPGNPLAPIAAELAVELAKIPWQGRGR